jgi:hypothetical protein
MTEVLSFMSTLSDEDLYCEDSLFRKFMYLSHVESHTPCATCSTGTLKEHSAPCRGRLNGVQG